MLKDATYKEKYSMLKFWMPQVIENVKKDLKNEHLKNDFKFAKKHLTGKNINKLTTEDFINVYMTALEQEENAEEIGEFITNRWLLKNSELYDYFERALSQITADFTQLTEIEPNRAQGIVDGAVAQFGAPRTYIFSVMNSVVFPKDVYEKLDRLAREDQKKFENAKVMAQEQLAHETLKDHYEQKIARLVDKYEKKLQGLQKKYLQDTESLRKQLAVLQKKLNA